MDKVFLDVLNFIFISAAIYFSIASICIVFGKRSKRSSTQNNLAFDELASDKSATDYTKLPQLKSYQTRDGKRLPYRHYDAKSDKVVVFLHGSGWHSQYLFPLTDFLSSEGLAQVYTPDLRGHGQAPERRGDVDYIDQLEDDLADFIELIKTEHPDCKLIVAGHSSGGGLAVRFAGSRYGKRVDAYVLLSPYLKYNAPIMRPNSGGWAAPHTLRIVGLTMLNNIGIHQFDYVIAIDFNMPQEFRNGTETLSYTHRLNTAFAPRNYKQDLCAITQPLLVLVGTADEAFIAEQFEPVFSQYTSAQVTLLPDVTHMGVVVNPAVRPILRQWFENLHV
ncbi:alpha/beta hydrolase fold [Shewanella halifaxensis HAW-EB4]|uniref:Alpha/beta hydrolase fold n=1 Tax=Shewanella halifaxensis (strain HAW-EB4) TaxID=458817 RepID=B0TNF0_SHEHH|nr:alpha/beta fold hydrolase [Shewanella halifaxensis]ABZ77464.1 alpha/beta hydrolase fold [Shewanella halifaxensis HAW-EB4]